MKNTKKILLFIWAKLNKYKLHFFLSFIFFGALVVIRNVVVPIYIAKVTDALTLVDFAGAYRALWMLLGLYFFSRLVAFLSMHILSWFQSRLSRDLDRFSYFHFTKHEYHFYKDQFTGSLVDKAKRLGRNMVSIMDNFLFNMYGVAVVIIGILWVLFKENIQIGLIFTGFLLLNGFLLIWMSKKLSPVYKDRSVSKSNFSGVVSDILTNIQTILFFENREKDLERFDLANEEFHKKRYRAWRMSVNYQDIIAFLPTLFTGGVTLYSVYLSELGVLSTGSVILIFLLSNNMNRQMWFLSRSTKTFTSDVSDLAEAVEIIERVPAVRDSENAQEFLPGDGSITFDDVSFTYPKGEHVFEKFNFDILPGQSVGIVGKSGSGKTTITKLLLGLYNLDAGAILIDGQDIGAVQQASLRKNITYIPQETILFHRTIYENIAYGNPSATKEQIMEASKNAYVDEFVQKLEHGYDTKVGERGVKLSGGQRQRIGIARAMLKSDAPILLLDEATSALDSKSEKYIQASFKTLSKDRTTIVVAHRLSTIQELDRILVMENGNLIEDGSHDELMKKNGYYADLWNAQMEGYSLD